MADKPHSSSHDFDSTIQLDLSKMDPYELAKEMPLESYGMPEELEDTSQNLDDTLDSDIENLDLSDLGAELDALVDEFSLPDDQGPIEPQTSTNDPIEKSDSHDNNKTVILETKADSIEKTTSISDAESTFIIPPEPSKKSMSPPPKQVSNPEPKQAPKQMTKPVPKTPSPSPKVFEEESVEDSILNEPDLTFNLTDEMLEEMPQNIEKPAPKPVQEEAPNEIKRTQEKVVPYESAVTTEAQSSGGSMFAMMIAIAGIIAGGTGIWMASTANSQIIELQQHIQTLEAQLRTHIKTVATVSTPAPVVAPIVNQKEPVKPTTIKKANKPTPKLMVKPITPATPISTNIRLAGGWVVYISSHVSQTLAEKAQTSLAKTGVSAVIQSSTIKGRVWHRVQTTGFSSKSLAKAYLKKLQDKNHIKGAWIGKTKG
ncbi:MAG: SPOR domain-containing protein [Mariprofundaceae bacterium]